MSSQKIKCIHIDIPIATYIDAYKQNKYGMPVWQREDCWKDEFRKELIKSILLNIDLPKIYIAEFKTKTSIIIDGGHRTRAIFSYMNNEYYIKLDNEEEIYYNQIPRASRNKRVMNATEKEQFDNYKLTISKYENTTEKQCRHIFNILQNAQPMSVADVMNSWESDLVDYLRSLQYLNFRTSKCSFNLYNYFTGSKNLPNPENNEIMYQLASFFTILFPQEKHITPPDMPKNVSMKYLEKGKTRNSVCLKYVKEFDEEITQDMDDRFKKSILELIKFLEKKKFGMSDINTYYHAVNWIPKFSEVLFIEFISKVEEYTQLKNLAKKNNKGKKYADAQAKNTEADEINTEYDGAIEEWVKSRTSGGSGYKGMKTRYDIILKYCLDENLKTQPNDQETYYDSITIEELGEVL